MSSLLKLSFIIHL